MEQRKTAADRVRPILAMMERCIESARQERTRDETPASVGCASAVGSLPSIGASASSVTIPPARLASPVVGGVPSPAAPPAPIGAAHSQSIPGGAGSPSPSGSAKDRPRLKARPKRPNTFVNNRLPDPQVHSRAG